MYPYIVKCFSVIYDPNAPDNEEQSAELFKTFAEDLCIPVSRTNCTIIIVLFEINFFLGINLQNACNNNVILGRRMILLKFMNGLMQQSTTQLKHISQIILGNMIFITCLTLIWQF